MDYGCFVLIVGALIALWWLTKRLDRKAKDQIRRDAYRLLDMENPSEEEVKKTLKGLMLYGGRMRPDKEFVALRQRLSKKLAQD